MVQIRKLQQKAPSTFKFRSRVKFRIGRRLQPLKDTFSDCGRNFKELRSEDGQSKDLFHLRRIGSRVRTGVLGFSRSWGLAGTLRWLRLARNNFLLREDPWLRWTVNRRMRENEEPVTKVLTGADCEGSSYRERSWGLEKQRGKLKITTWMNGKGRRSLRAPLMGDSEDGEEQGEASGPRKRKECDMGEGSCGCTGGRIWRSRERYREDLVESEGQKKNQNAVASADDQAALPDDIIEMCLARTPFASLIRARAVCKKWKSLTSSPHFLQLRGSIRSWDPWLFLFGLSRDGVCLGQIQALDPASSRWHTIKADILTGRLSYSVAAVHSVIYIVGGCSSNFQTASGRSDKESLKTLKTVLMYTPLTGSWRKVCPLTTERAAPIVGVFQVRGTRTFGGESTYKGTGLSTSLVNLKWASDLYCGRSSPGRGRVCERGSRHGGELAVYGGPETRVREMHSGNNTAMEGFGDLINRSQQGNSAELLESEFKRLNIQGSRKGAREQRTFGLIAVGGQGTWNEQLDSAEIYDPVTDNWREIASLPADHGTPCAGVVCKSFFYVYSESNKLAAYDLEHEVWHSIGVSQAPARLLDYTPKLVSCKDRIFLLGVAWGMISDSNPEMATRNIWELHQEPTSTDWVNVSQHPDAPLDWNAVFVADEEVIFGVEMFKIFGQMLDFVTICKISGSGGMAWERVSRMEMAMHEMDPSSCLTKTAIVVRL